MFNMQDLKGADLNGLFIGIVEDNNDPMKLERVRARISIIHDGVTTDQLPWCIKRVSNEHVGTLVGTFGVPRIGAALLIEFQQGDPHNPIYVGAVRRPQDLIPQADTNYPNRWGWLDVKGNFFYSDTETGDVHIEHFSGTKYHIDASGNVTETVVGTKTSNVVGTYILHSDTHINLTAPRIDWN